MLVNVPIKEKAISIAKVCHQANKAYCESFGEMAVDWEDAPEWQKQSAINGVLYHLNNPGSKPEDSHISWSKEKIEQGWVYGEIKDAEKKTHPCLVNYKDLPFEQQIKDYLFLAIVRALTGPVL